MKKNVQKTGIVLRKSILTTVFPFDDLNSITVFHNWV